MPAKATTIPIHGAAEIGGGLFKSILKQLGISDASQFRRQKYEQ
ncbi:MAG: type II toxin-antitoxin system HicA family toxin [Cyanobacteria bacterium P01_D01_bin.1]